MDYNKSIYSMNIGDEVEGFYLLKDASIKTTTTGKSFLSGTIADVTGQMELKVWDYSGPLGTPDAGKIVWLRGEVGEYKGIPQFSAARIRLATASDNYSVEDIVPSAPIDAEKTYENIKNFISTIKDDDYRRMCEAAIERHGDALRHIPAAKSVHHSFLCGLLMHTANMLRCADLMSKIYADVIDRSLLLTGTLFHDLAKEIEFTFSELGTVTDYSTKGQLLGHLVMGAQDAAKIAGELGIPEEKSLLLQHMILSHHGEPEYGAAVKPMFAEAELLSYIDMIDSRMEIYSEVYGEVPKGSFSGNIFALEKKIYHHN